jgi:hypothetical protein
MAKPITVEITQDDNGELTLSLPTATVQQGQEMEWTSAPALHFAVHFEYPNLRPFRKSIFHKEFRSGVPQVGSGSTPYPYRVHVREAETVGYVKIGSSQQESPGDWREA